MVDRSRTSLALAVSAAALLTHGLQRLSKESNQGGTITPGISQKAYPGRRSEGRRDQHFRVILDPSPLRSICPRVIKDKLTHAVALQVERTGCNKLLLVIHC